MLTDRQDCYSSTHRAGAYADEKARSETGLHTGGARRGRGMAGGKKVKVKGRGGRAAMPKQCGEAPDALSIRRQGLVNTQWPVCTVTGSDISGAQLQWPGKTDTPTASHPEGGDNTVQRPCLYGPATMYYGLNPTSKWPLVSKATCGQSADQGGTPGPGQQECTCAMCRA